MAGPARRVYGKPWSKMSGITITPEVLEKLGQCLIKTLVYEAKKDFAKRGWPLRDPKGGPALPDSFSMKIKGESTIEIYTSFYGLTELMSGDIPERKMEWLTQEHKKEHPEKFPLTKGERRRGMHQGGKRLPLIVPIESNGTVILRAAPLTTADAWIHPGIAKFTFAQRGIRKGRKACVKLIAQFVAEELAKGNPFA